MKKPILMLILLLASLDASAAWAQSTKYPALSEYMMPRDAEVALAGSAAPRNISDRATIKVLTTSGFQVARDGDNGFVCIVMLDISSNSFVSFYSPGASGPFALLAKN